MLLAFVFLSADAPDTVKSPLPVHFALPSFSRRREIGARFLQSSSAFSLLFALYSSTYPALTLGEFFTMQPGSGRVRVGRIPSPGDTRTASRLCTVSSLVPSAFENALSFSLSSLLRELLIARFFPPLHRLVVSSLLDRRSDAIV